MKCLQSLRQFALREDGASLLEYAFLLGLIALAVLVAITDLGDGLKTSYENLQSHFVDNNI